jgi:hypothetical protein
MDKDSFVWVQVNPAHAPDGPYRVIGESGNNWLKLEGLEKKVQRAHVVSSEYEAYSRYKRSLEIRKRLIEKKIKKVDAYLSELSQKE